MKYEVYALFTAEFVSNFKLLFTLTTKLAVKEQLGFVPENKIILNSPVDVSNVYGDITDDMSVVPSYRKSV